MLKKLVSYNFFRELFKEVELKSWPISILPKTNIVSLDILLLPVTLTSFIIVAKAEKKFKNKNNDIAVKILIWFVIL